MGKSKKNRAAATKQIQLKSQTTAEAFSFGDPVPVLDRRELLDYVECVQMDRWYEPPVSFDGLARTFRAAVHHSSPIAVKCNILTSTYIPHPLLSQQAFSRFVQDYLVFGNAYLEKRTNRFGEVIALEPALAKYTRRGLDLDTYWFVQYGKLLNMYYLMVPCVKTVFIFLIRDFYPLRLKNLLSSQITILNLFVIKNLMIYVMVNG